MKKHLLGSVCLLGVFSLSILANAQEAYVRKPVKPNFFIPKGALAQSKPERVGIPQYREGVSTAKRITNEPETTYKPTKQIIEEETYLPEEDVYENQNTPQIEPQTKKEKSIAQSSNTTETTETTETPEYQLMYQQYLKNLEEIAATGSTKSTKAADDIKIMNSENRIKIDQEFNKKRNVKKEILKALEE